MQKFLVIQTAFIGDVVLATGIIEKLHAYFPDAQIDFLVRKGNEALLLAHPYLHEALVWDKKQHKLRNLWNMGRRIRRAKYDTVINVQRFAATGLLTVFSGARTTIGFDKNPLSRFFTRRIPHIVSANSHPEDPGSSTGPAHIVNRRTEPADIVNGGTGPPPTRAAGETNASGYVPGKAPDAPTRHEIERNQDLIRDLTDDKPAKPRLYPSAADYEKVRPYQGTSYLTVSPASVWFTKQYPKDRWIGFIRKLPAFYTVYLLGAPSDKDLCEEIRQAAGSVTPTATPGIDIGASASHSGPGPRVINLSGQLSFLQSAALMKDAAMNYVNDSAPMHFSSAVNAPVTAVYCSTIPAFGFGPLSDQRFIVEIQGPLDCRPCGLHGYKACPLGHFNCAYRIADEQLLQTLA